MQKAEKYIQARLQRFTDSCNNVLQILNMQKQVCDLSEDEVNKLDEKTREYYKAIKTNKDAIQVRIDFITGIFTNPVKTDASNDLVKSRTRGIFSTAKMYYHKAKTVYIGNKNNKEGVWLRDNLCSFKGDDYNGYVKDDYEYESSIDNKDVYDEVKKDLNKGKLTTEDIKKIAKQAKAMNMTIKDYLAYCGFNTQSMPDGGILVSEAVNKESTFWNRTENSCGANGYKVNDVNAKENYTVLLTDRSYQNAQNKGTHFIYFRTR